MLSNTPVQSPLSSDRRILTVACVYRTGGRLYSPRYVTTLAAMVRRNLTLPYRFVCLTDSNDVTCERIALINNWSGFHSKSELFRPGLFSGPLLYFDLDTVIHRSIDRLAERAYEIPFGCVSDPLGGHMNSSVLSFTVDCSIIYQRFKKLGLYDRHIRPHLWFLLRRIGLERPFAMGSSYGDQGFAEMCLNDFGIPITHTDQILPGVFSTFNFTAGPDDEPAGSVCLMMGRPKPHEIATGWIGKHWSTEVSHDKFTP